MPHMAQAGHAIGKKFSPRGKLYLEMYEYRTKGKQGSYFRLNMKQG